MGALAGKVAVVTGEIFEASVAASRGGLPRRRSDSVVVYRPVTGAATLRDCDAPRIARSICRRRREESVEASRNA